MGKSLVSCFLTHGVMYFQPTVDEVAMLRARQTQTGQCDCHSRLHFCTRITSVSWPSAEKQSLKYHAQNANITIATVITTFSSYYAKELMKIF